MTKHDVTIVTKPPMDLGGLVTLLAVDSHGPTPEPTPEEDMAQARAELDEALAALRRARAQWKSAQAMEPEAIRVALDIAERQLDAARVRLQRALERRGRGGS